MVFALFQPLPESQLTLSAVAVIGAVTVGLQWLIGRDTRNKLEGSFGARLDAHDTSIKELKDAKGEIWTEVNKHAVQIGQLQTAQEMKRSHHV